MEKIYAREVIAIMGWDIRAQVDLLKQGFVGFKMAIFQGALRCPTENFNIDHLLN